MLTGLYTSPVKAQDATPVPTEDAGEEEDVRIEFTGEVISVEQQDSSNILIVTLLTYEGEVEIKVNPATESSEEGSTLADLLVVGESLTIIASMDDDGEELVAVAKDVSVAEEEVETTPTPEPTPCEGEGCPTATPTLEPTPAATEAATCGGNNAHPVASRLAESFDVSYDEIMGWHCQGMGFGGIAKAYIMAEKLAEKLGEGAEGLYTAEELLLMKQSGMGWGQIRKQVAEESEVDIHPSELAPGGVIKGKGKKDADDADATGKNGKPAKTKKPKNNKGKNK